MDTKLTLTIEKDIIERAKIYAKYRKRSLSDIIENYLKTLTDDSPKKEKESKNPLVESLRGSVKMPKDLDYKKELRERLEKKYL